MENRFTGTERRRFNRVLASFLVVYKVAEQTECTKAFKGRDLVAVMNDLSEGGLSMLTNHDIPETCGFLLEFTIINHDAREDKRVRTIEVRGGVKYKILTPKGERRLGISFDQIDGEDQAAIVDLKKVAAV